MRLALILAALWSTAGTSLAHDTWVQTNTNLVRTGDAVHVDLMLGNHGNDHRDFKLASKLDPDGGDADRHRPGRQDVRPEAELADLGYAAEGGLPLGQVRHGQAGPVRGRPDAGPRWSTTASRSGRSAAPRRTSWPARAWTRSRRDWTGFDKPLGHALELVPEANPVAPMGPGTTIKVRVLFQGKPLADARVSFVPRGETLAEGFDKTYERTTDADGRAASPRRPATTTWSSPTTRKPATGKAEYESIAYSATLTVFVPEVCPCCGE